MEPLLLDIGWTPCPSDVSFVQTCRSYTYIRHQTELQQHCQPSRFPTIQCAHTFSYAIAMVSLRDRACTLRALVRIQTAVTGQGITSFVYGSIYGGQLNFCVAEEPQRFFSNVRTITSARCSDSNTIRIKAFLDLS